MRNIGELMAKAHKVQSQMTILQTKMAEQEFEGSAAGGAVTVVLTGKGNAVRVHMDKTALEDAETLEDLLVVAINDSREKAENYLNSEMQKMQASLGLPPDFKMPF
ncbi:MAG: YbaB/EbfC family nucleoid-associated protein [Alphaproteobacteria bacterium]